jgi:Ca-activated chloride channel family protein
VILCTDGDFNVGITSSSELVERIRREARSGVYLTVLGFGMGNLKDSKLEQLADHGNGNYAYIDTKHEARKVLVEEAGATLVTIAKDVKIQVEFNPDRVEAYRLIGYENRRLESRDFNDDTKDAGEIGAGHTVTALYEIVPAGSPVDVPAVDELRYSRVAPTEASLESGELLTVKVRYKEPTSHTSRLVRLAVVDEGLSLASASPDFRFAAAVAAFGMQLTGSEHLGEFGGERIAELAESGARTDRDGHRTEFLSLVRKANELRPPVAAAVHESP